MKKVILLSVVSFLLLSSLKAQYVYKIKADSVKITNDSCTAELIIENTTKGVSGFLYNKGNGRTEFRRVIKLGDTAIVIGIDTIKSLGGSGAAWLLTGNNGINSTNFLGTINNYRLPIRTNNIERMVIDSIGRVGIGTINPNTRLEVNSLKGDYSPYIPQIWSNAAARINSGNLSIFSTGDTSVAGDSYQMDFYSRYYNTGQGYVTNKSGFVKGRTSNNTTLYPGQASGQGTLILGSSNTNYNNTSIIDTPAIYITNGAVGIRTSSPGATLHVADTSGGILLDPRLSRNIDRIRIGNYINKYDGQNILLSTSSDNGLTFKNIVSERDGNVAIGTGNPTNMSWVMGNVGSLRVHSDGRVGIGHNYFHFGSFGGPFNSSALVMSVSNSNEWNDYTSYPNGQNSYYFGTILGAPYNGAIRAPLKISGNELHFLTAAVDSEAVRITKLGNVLIGTTTDSIYKLDVNGSGRFKGSNLIVGNNFQQYNNTYPLVINNGPYSLKFGFDPNGYYTRIFSQVGLEITGQSNGFFRIIPHTFTTTLDTIGMYSTNNKHSLYAGTSGGLGFYTDGTSINFNALKAIWIDNNNWGFNGNYINAGVNNEGFRLTNTGNFLIGTTNNAGFKLDVNGTAKIATIPFIANRDTVLTYDPTTNQIKATKIGTASGSNTTKLSADVTNSTTTIANVTGLSFSVTANTTYKFRFFIVYTAAATTTGSRWSVNGPSIAGGFLHYKSEYSLTSTTITNNQGLSAFDLPAGSNGTSATTGSNIAIIEGVIKPTASGTVTARFASEVGGSAIVAKGGMSFVQIEVLQ